MVVCGRIGGGGGVRKIGGCGGVGGGGRVGGGGGGGGVGVGGVIAGRSGDSVGFLWWGGGFEKWWGCFLNKIGR